MPTYRNINATFIGINQQPISRAAIKIEHLSGSNAEGVEFPIDTKTYYTNDEGQVSFKLWCNEEGERPSTYKITLPGGESFSTVVPVGTSDLQLDVLRDGGVDSGDQQYQTLISYILSQVGTGGGGSSTPIASATVSGKVKTNTTVGDPVVYLKTEVDNLLDSKANSSATYTKTEVDSLVAGAGSGETNTASNVGTAGVGVFKQKTGVNLEFRNINAGSTKVTVTSDTANNEIDIDVAEANLSLSNIGGTLPINKGGTGATSASAALTALGALGTSTRGAANGVASLDASTLIPVAQIPSTIARVTDITATQAGAIATSARGAANGVASLDASTLVPDAQISTNIARTSALTTHTSNTSNPHSTTAAQVGAIATTDRGAVNGVASLDASGLVPDTQISTNIARTSQLGNALQIQGRSVSNTAPTTGQSLVWNGTLWVPQTVSGGGSTVSAQAVGGTGRWYFFNIGTSTGTNASAINTLWLIPQEIQKTIPIDTLGINITVAGTGAAPRLGIYSSDSSGLPTTLVLDAGTIDATTTGGKNTNTFSLTLNPGVYWFAYLTNVAITVTTIGTSLNLVPWMGATSIGGSAVSGRNVSQTYGTLPSTISGTTPQASAPQIYCRLA